MTPEQRRRSAIDNTRERLEVLLALAQHTGYPLNLEQRATDIVDAILALTKPRPVFPWPSDRLPVQVDANDEQRLRDALATLEPRR